MKKILFSLLLLATFLTAQAINQPINADFLKKNIKIIDIRTAPEWKETGVIKDSIALTFFDEAGNYDMNGFLTALNAKVKKGETFALICRSGSRSAMVANYLGQNGYNVINLQGGISYAQRQGMKLVPYRTK